jgi:hypothetical protein
MSIQVTPGVYDSIVVKCNPACDVKEYIEAVNQQFSKQTKGAVFAHVPATLYQTSEFFQFMEKGIFKFHHYENENKTHVCYGWSCLAHPKDNVAPYATSIGGVGTIILSPDEKEVLLIFEYGKFKVVTGRIESRESVCKVAIKETSEELNVLLDKSFTPICVGGWQIGNDVNDNFWVVVVKAASCDFKPDGFEVKKADWFNIDYLLKNKPDAMKFFEGQTGPINKASVFIDKTPFSFVSLEWINNWKEQRFLKIYQNDNVTIFA